MTRSTFCIFRFDGFIHEELAAMGIVRVEVLDEGLKFVKKDLKRSLITTDLDSTKPMLVSKKAK